MNVKEVLLKLKVTIEQFKQERDARECVKLTDTLLLFLDSLNENVETIDRHSEEELQDSALLLWNIAVTRKAGHSFSNCLIAKVRHIACNLIFLATNKNESEISLSRQAMMATKTSRAWLDCCNYPAAESSLGLAQQTLEKLKNFIQEKADKGIEPNFESKKTDVNNQLFKVLCYKAETACAQEDFSCAANMISKAKELVLDNMQGEYPYFSMLCYNLGVDCFVNKNFEYSVTFLRDSFEIGKDKVSSSEQARTLRLLAEAHLNWKPGQQLKEALQAVELANAEHLHESGLYLKMKVLLQEPDGSEQELQTAIDELLRHPEFSADLGLSTLQLLTQYKKHESALGVVQHLTARFELSQSAGKIHLQHVELLLQMNNTQQAQDLLHKIVKEHVTTKVMDAPSCKRLSVILWEKAAFTWKEGEFAEALQWYEFALNFLDEKEDSRNLAKLYKNMALCFFQLAKYSKAFKCADEAEKLDPKSLHTLFIQYKIALSQGEHQQAIVCLQKISLIGQEEDIEHKEEVDIKEVITLCAQLAFEKSNKKISIAALENLIQFSVDDGQILISLRCLTRLRLSLMTTGDTISDNETSIQAFIGYLKTAQSKIEKMKISGNDENSNIHEEASWFMKIAWNFGLENEKSCRIVYDSFVLCYKFAALCSTDTNILNRQKISLVTATAACLQLVKEKTGAERKEQVTLLEETLLLITKCSDVCTKIQDAYTLESEDIQRKDPVPALLVLYEFEAKLRLGKKDELDSVLAKAKKLPQANAKTYETIAALAMEDPFQNRTIGIKALQMSIDRYLKTDNWDADKISTLFHGLVECAICEAKSGVKQNIEEAWTHFSAACDFIEKKAKDLYPNNELIWLMTTAWNYGIHLFSNAQYENVIKWCTKAMKLLQIVSPTYRSDYEKKINENYQELLSKLPSKLKSSISGQF